MYFYDHMSWAQYFEDGVVPASSETTGSNVCQHDASDGLMVGAQQNRTTAYGMDALESGMVVGGKNVFSLVGLLVTQTAPPAYHMPPIQRRYSDLLPVVKNGTPLEPTEHDDVTATLVGRGNVSSRTLVNRTATSPSREPPLKVSPNTTSECFHPHSGEKSFIRPPQWGGVTSKADIQPHQHLPLPSPDFKPTGLRLSPGSLAIQRSAADKPRASDALSLVESCLVYASTHHQLVAKKWEPLPRNGQNSSARPPRSAGCKTHRYAGSHGNDGIKMKSMSTFTSPADDNVGFF